MSLKTPVTMDRYFVRYSSQHICNANEHDRAFCQLDLGDSLSVGVEGRGEI